MTIEESTEDATKLADAKTAEAYANLKAARRAGDGERADKAMEDVDKWLDYRKEQTDGDD